MSDSLNANPWRRDPTSGGLVYQDVELRYGEEGQRAGALLWTDADGQRARIAAEDYTVGPSFDHHHLGMEIRGPEETHADVRAQGGPYAAGLSLRAAPDGTSQALLNDRVVIDEQGNSEWIKSAFRGIGENPAFANMSVRAGIYTGNANVPAGGAGDMGVQHAPGALPAPDLVLAQVVDVGGPIYYGISVSGTTNYTTVSFDATIQNHTGGNIVGPVTVAFLVIYFDLP